MIKDNFLKTVLFSLILSGSIFASRLHDAVRQENTKALQDLIAAGDDLNKKSYGGNTPLHLAVYLGNHEAVELLLKAGADTCIENELGETPLMSLILYVSENHPVEKWRVSSLLRHFNRFANLESCLQARNRNGLNLFEEAIRRDENSFLETLLLTTSNAENISCDQTKIITHIAQTIFIGHFTGPKRHVIDTNNTLLHFATSVEKIKAIKILLKTQGRVYAKNSNGNTPLHIAAYRMNFEIIDLFLKSSHPVNIGNNSGETPLHIALKIPTNNENKHISNIINEDIQNTIVETLIRANADPNAQTTESKKTPLHYAIENGYQYKIIKMLCDAEADVTLKDSEGHTPLDSAISRGENKITSLLQSHIPKQSPQKNIKPNNKKNKTSRKKQTRVK